MKQKKNYIQDGDYPNKIIFDFYAQSFQYIGTIVHKILIGGFSNDVQMKIFG